MNMSEPAVDLWPADLGKDKVITPSAILRQQASLLGKRTHNLVEAKVETTTLRDKFIHRFVIEAPPLGNYKYTLFTLAHPVGLYPIEIVNGPTAAYPSFPQISEGIGSEKDLLAWLKWVLNEDETKRVINGLLSEIES